MNKNQYLNHLLIEGYKVMYFNHAVMVYRGYKTRVAIFIYNENGAYHLYMGYNKKSLVDYDKRFISKFSTLELAIDEARRVMAVKEREGYVVDVSSTDPRDYS